MKFKNVLWIICVIILGFLSEGFTTNSNQNTQKEDSLLNADEQQFAYGLTPENRILFCSKFTPVQRAAAMQITSQPDPTGALTSPDQAVVIVARANELLPPSENPTVCPGK